MPELTAAEMAGLRLANQLLSAHDLTTPEQVVTHMAAMQAQDLASAKWSLGLRLGIPEAEVDTALEAGEILRTWPMRGTLHFVPPQDARWMLRVTGERALAGAAARRAYLGLDLETVEKAATVLESALRGGKRLTRSQAIAVMNDAGIETAGQHSYHLIWYVAQIGVTCIGPNQGKEQTLVLLDEWAPDQPELDDDEALAELALRYFTSHGPTTHTDFMGWAGIGARLAKAAIAANGDALVRKSFAGKDVWLGADARDRAAESAQALERTLVLPGFDEFILGYKDRSLMLAAEHRERIVPGGNGVFQPTVVDRGRVVATWRRANRAKAVKITVLPFEPFSGRQRRRVENAFTDYAAYVGKPVEITFA